MILKNGRLWYLNFAIFFLLSGYILPEAKSKNISPINTVDQLLDILDSKKPTIIKTYSERCPFCSMIAPTFEKIANQSKYKAIAFHKADGKALEAHKHVSHKSDGKHKIPGYPTFIFIHKGNIVDLLIGGDEKKLTEKIEKFMKSI